MNKIIYIIYAKFTLFYLFYGLNLAVKQLLVSVCLNHPLHSGLSSFY